jgi:predicted anti-sigma-YlaC factor YlaD
MKKKHPTCDDYMRMPLTQEVINHIRSCEKCRAVYNALADEVDRHAYEFEHRN